MTGGDELTDPPKQPAATRRSRWVWPRLVVLIGVAGALFVGFVVVPNALLDRQIRAAAEHLESLGPQAGQEKAPDDETALGVHAQLSSEGVSWVSDGCGHIALSGRAGAWSTRSALTSPPSP